VTMLASSSAAGGCGEDGSDRGRRGACRGRRVPAQGR
jgi:hypothetical protein